MAEQVRILHPASGRPITVSAAQRARLYPDAELADQPKTAKPKRSTRKTKKEAD